MIDIDNINRIRAKNSLPALTAQQVEDYTRANDGALDSATEQALIAARHAADNIIAWARGGNNDTAVENSAPMNAEEPLKPTTTQLDTDA